MDDLFFYFDNSKLVLWDVETHSQWELDLSTTQFLFEGLLSADTSKKQAAIHFLEESGASTEEGARKYWEWDVLSYFFHKGTCNVPTTIDTTNSEEWCEHYQAFSRDNIHKVKNLHHYPASSILLTKSKPESDLYTFLSEREVNRQFDAKNISLDIFERMISSTFCFRETAAFSDFMAENNIESILYKRSAPSAGGLQSVEAYINIKAVEGVPSGLYLFNPIECGLCFVSKQIENDQIVHVINGQPFAQDSAFDVIYVSNFEKLWKKYQHSRCYRAALLDVGHLSQNLLLCAQAEGIESFVTGSLNDEVLANLLQLEATTAPIFFASFGYGTRQFVPMSYFR